MAISPVLFIGLIYLAGGGSLFPGVEAIWLTVPESGERCVYEEIQANVVVVLDYICIDDAFTQLGPTLDVRVCTSTIYTPFFLRKFHASGKISLLCGQTLYI